MLEHFEMPYHESNNYLPVEELLRLLIDSWLEDTSVLYTGIEKEELDFFLVHNLHFDNEYVLLKERVFCMTEKIISNSLQHGIEKYSRHHPKKN